MTKRIECPPESVLKELIDGKVDEPQLSELSEHVEECGTCQERAKTLTPNDTLVQSLRSDPESAKKIADGIPRPLIEKVKDIARSESKPGADTMAVPSEDPPTSAKPGETELDFLASAQQPDEIGRLGTYRILKVLGKGGMGVVFLADDPELDRKVALKVMLPNIAANPSAKQRFLREARTAAKLRNDHIVTIYQVSEVGGVPFLAMELLDGMPLDGVLQSSRPLKLAQILCIGQDVAKGLAAAHEKGLIHRDIKPGNLWLDQAHGGRVKILDFGLARAEQDDIHLTQSGAIVGTPAYMAPEQARGDKAVDARVDLFSLGCVLYRLCAGDIPFKGDTTMGVLLAIAMNDPVPPVSLNNQIPPALSELIMQLLEKDPAKRPVSARDVIARLQEIEKSVAALRDDLQKTDAGGVPNDATNVDMNLAGQPAAAEPGLLTALEQAKAEAKAAPAPTLPPRKRRPVVLALAALLFVGLIALGGSVYYWQTNNGIVRIEINDPDIKVAFDKDGPTVTAADKKDIKLRAGEHGLHIQRGDLEFDTDKFILKRGETITLKIEWFKEGLLQVVQGDKVIGKEVQKKIEVAVIPHVAAKYALRFDGKQRVEIPNLKIDPKVVKEHTVEAWVLIDAKANDKGTRLVGNVNFGLGCATEKGVIHALFSNADPKAKTAKAVTAGDVPKEWAHLAGTFDGKRISLFVNGKQINAGNPIDPFEVQAPLFLGTDFTGSIGEVRISKVARYGKDYTPARRFDPDADTLVLYHFDEGTGDVLNDSSGNGHHGKIVGAKWVKADGTPIAPVVPLPDKDLIQGRWQPVSGHVNGKPMSDAMLKTITTVILSGDQMSFTQMGQRMTGSFRVEPDKSPKEFDVIRDVDQKGMRGIYQLDKDELQLCLGEPGTVRPKTFTTTAGSTLLSIVLRREPPPYKNALGMQFALVPKGKSWLGGGNGKPGDKVVEMKDDFYLGVYEVTQEEWEKVMGSNPSYFALTGGGKDIVKKFDKDVTTKRFPVESVSWDDCQKFLAKLNEQTKETGWEYRLPAEAEWEYACRGGPMTDPADSEFDFYLETPTKKLLAQQANFVGYPRTSKVGAFPANRLGLHDMHGNVWEWCDDRIGSGATRRVVVRGGCWGAPLPFCSAAYRDVREPWAKDGFSGTGLRVARVRVGTASIIPAGAPKLLATLTKTGAVTSLAFSPDWDSKARFLIAVGENITFLDLRRESPSNPKIIGAVLHQEKAFALPTTAISADRKTLALSGIDGKVFSTRVIEVPGRKKLVEFNPKYIQIGAALSPDGKTLVYGDEVGLLFRGVPGNAAEVVVKQVKDHLYAGLKFSPDGRYVTGLHYDNRNPGKGAKLVILDAKTRVTIATKEAENKKPETFPWGPVWISDISHDSKEVVIVGGTKNEKPAWYSFSLPKGNLVHVEENLPDRCTGGALSPVAAHLALGFRDGTVQIWDTNQKKRLFTWNASTKVVAKQFSTIHAVAFSPDGKMLATALSTGEIRLWDLTTAEAAIAPPITLLHRIPWAPDKIGLHIFSVDVSPDGQYFQASRIEPAKNRVWETKDGKQLAELPQSDGRFVRGNLIVARSSNSEAFHFHLEGGSKQFMSLPIKPSRAALVVRAQFTPSGDHLWMQTAAKGEHMVEAEVWNSWTKPGKLCTFSCMPADSVVLMPDGKHVLHQLHSKPPLKVLDTATGKPVDGVYAQLRDVPPVLAVSADGKRLACGIGPIKIYEVATGKEIASLEGARAPVAINGDGTRVLAATTGQGIGCWDLAKESRLVGTISLPETLNFPRGHGVFRVSQDGRFAVVGGLQFVYLFSLPELPDLAQEPINPVWIKAVAAMEGKQQEEAIRTKFKDRNRGNDPTVLFGKRIDETLTELTILSDNLTDLTALQALPGLRKLVCAGSDPGKGRLRDLSPLKDLKLTFLTIHWTKVSDLTPLKDMRLTHLNCFGTEVSDLAPHSDMKLVYLACQNTDVRDLKPLKGMSLNVLYCQNTKVTDLTPLQGMPLRELRCDAEVAQRNAAILRSIPTLETINGKDAKEFLK